jgi:hypothetical protein
MGINTGFRYTGGRVLRLLVLYSGLEVSQPWDDQSAPPIQALRAYFLFPSLSMLLKVLFPFLP